MVKSSLQRDSWYVRADVQGVPARAWKLLIIERVENEPIRVEMKLVSARQGCTIFLDKALIKGLLRHTCIWRA
jgi:hypothetical protein